MPLALGYLTLEKPPWYKENLDGTVSALRNMPITGNGIERCIQMGKRTFLMLAHDYKPKRDMVTSYYVSEKLDGIRAFWDGGISRGMQCPNVPWANVAKHARYVIAPLATGLWTRYAQPIQAPASFLDDLPPYPLDGELTMGRGTWQQLTSCVKSLCPDSRWNDVRYMIFDGPSLETVFENGYINTTGYKKSFQGIKDWLKTRIIVKEWGVVPFYKRLAELYEILDGNPIAKVLEQVKAPALGPQIEPFLEEKLSQVEAAGGEGLMLRSPISFWQPARTYSLLKVKRLKDAEGKVIGYKWAKPTDLEKSITGEQTDKLLGLMGSVRVRIWSGLEFDLSGFTHDERVMIHKGDGIDGERLARAREYGESHPGEVVSEEYENRNFPRGSVISFKYRELSQDGLPKEARYHRVRPEGI